MPSDKVGRKAGHTLNPPRLSRRKVEHKPSEAAAAPLGGGPTAPVRVLSAALTATHVLSPLGSESPALAFATAASLVYHASADSVQSSEVPAQACPPGAAVVFADEGVSPAVVEGAGNVAMVRHELTSTASTVVAAIIAGGAVMPQCRAKAGMPARGLAPVATMPARALAPLATMPARALAPVATMPARALALVATSSGVSVLI